MTDLSVFLIFFSVIVQCFAARLGYNFIVGCYSQQMHGVAFSEEVQVQSYAAVHSVFTVCVAYNVAACERSGG